METLYLGKDLRARGREWVAALATRSSAAAGLALVNLSWMLGVGALAVAPLGPEAVSWGVVAAVVGSVVGGCVVSAVARRPAEVSCPSSSLAVIHATLVGALLARDPGASLAQVWAALSLAVMLAGVLLLIAGRTRLSLLLEYIPRPVAAGFVAGIGVLVVLSQVPALLGASARVEPGAWAAMVFAARPGSLAVGAVAALTAWWYPRTRLPGHPLLAGIAAGSVLHVALSQVLAPAQLGPTLQAISLLATAETAVRSTWSAVGLHVLLETLWFVLPYAALLAFQAVMNAGVTATAVTALHGGEPDIDRTLQAQGVANVLSGALCALPLSTNAPLSLLAARNGTSVAVGLTASALVLVGGLAIAPVLAHVPLAACAGVLILSGFGMVDPWTRTLAARVRSARHRAVAADLAIVAAVAVAFCIGSVPLALATGGLLVLVLLVVRMCRATRMDCAAPAGSRRAGVACVQVEGVLFFANAARLAATVSQAAASAPTVVLDLGSVVALDSSAAHALKRAVVAAGVERVLLAGVRRPCVAHELAVAGLQASEQCHWFESREHALAWTGARRVLPRVLAGDRAPGEESPSRQRVPQPL